LFKEVKSYFNSISLWKSFCLLLVYYFSQRGLTL
jgi:hypothetical protein